jgi:hypothetical protein
VLIDSSDVEANFYFISEGLDTISLLNIDRGEFIPTIPTGLEGDLYLQQVSCINQEWNRNQVRFDSGFFNSTDARIQRVDLARNCLNAYLWEVILYSKTGDELQPFAHGWFNFPTGYYQWLFNQRNNRDFS